MKRFAAILAGTIATCGIFSGAVGTVYADDQTAVVSLSEPGAVEQRDHPVPFGKCGVWEIAIEEFQISSSDETMSIEASQMADLIGLGGIRIKATITEGEELLSKRPVIVREDNAVVLKMTFLDTYGIKEETVRAELSFTAIRNLYWDNEQGGYSRSSRSESGERNIPVLKKGDVMFSQPIEFTAYYDHIKNYQSTIRLSEESAASRQVLADGEEMYMAADKEHMLTFEFGGIASYNTCISAAQKTVNLYYSTEEIEEITELYPDNDFQFISFLGSPSFINSGELTFQAVGGEDTSVYSYEDEELTRLEGEYDSDSNTIVVRGIKRLGSYVVSSESIDDFSIKRSKAGLSRSRVVRVLSKK